MKHKLFFFSLISIGATVVGPFSYADPSSSWDETFEKEEAKLKAEKEKKEAEVAADLNSELNKKVDGAKIGIDVDGIPIGDAVVTGVRVPL